MTVVTIELPSQKYWSKAEVIEVLLSDGEVAAKKIGRLNYAKLDFKSFVMICRGEIEEVLMEDAFNKFQRMKMKQYKARFVENAIENPDLVKG